VGEHALQLSVADGDCPVNYSGQAGQVVARLLLDPPVLIPDVQHRVDDALDVLGGVLNHPVVVQQVNAEFVVELLLAVFDPLV